MATYKIGEAGATVFTAGGTPLYRLTPGLVVVEGTIETADSAAHEHAEVARRRLRGYADKRIKPAAEEVRPSGLLHR